MACSVCVLCQDYTPIPGGKLSLSVHVCAYLPLTNISYLSHHVCFPTLPLMWVPGPFCLYVSDAWVLLVLWLGHRQFDLDLGNFRSR
jgi:hypothetical protein